MRDICLISRDAGHLMKRRDCPAECGTVDTYGSVKCSIRLLNIVDAKRSETFLSQKRHANRVRRYNQRKRTRLTMVVIISALLSCAPDRSVWALPRNNWWARNAGDTIDIGAWPDSMFVANLRMSKTTFMLLCEAFIR